MRRLGLLFVVLLAAGADAGWQRERVRNPDGTWGLWGEWRWADGAAPPIVPPATAHPAAPVIVVHPPAVPMPAYCPPGGT